MMRRFLALLAAIFVMAGLAGPALAKPPMEAFGDVPEIRSMDLSPDGKQLIWLQRLDNGADVLTHFDLTTGKRRGLVQASEVKARYAYFVSNTQIIIIASEDTKVGGFRNRFEYSAAFAYNLQTDKLTRMLQRTEGLFPAQSGLGIVVGITPDGQNLLMPAFMGSAFAQPELDLLQVSLETGRGKPIFGTKGTDHTIDWLVNPQGVPIVREDFIEREQAHEIRYRDAAGVWKSIYKKPTPLPEISLVGSSADSSLLYVIDSNESEFMTLRTLTVADGALSGPVMQRPDVDIAGVVSDPSRIVRGVRYSGMFPTYEMFDLAIENDIAHVQQSYEGSAVYLTAWSADWSKMLFFMEGGYYAERYVLFDRATRKLSVVANARSKITPDDVGEVMTITYKARDGLPIPALVTWPTGVSEENRKNLPMIVMPHGGPEAADTVGFDWLAQFLANEGYVVLQPNFRGSAGLGASFVRAGHSEWGRKMQDDITDGANALAKMGWADPERTCIVGWSYGGYAALAGGALTPDQYKCVVAVAGVSHLYEMLFEEKRQHGEKSRTYSYWTQFIGDPDKDRPAIDAVSPALLADRFKAPVLLIHGETDRIVPLRQSNLMDEALRKAGKSVKYVRIPGDDHGLVDNASRRKVLTELAGFLKTQIGQ